MASTGNAFSYKVEDGIALIAMDLPGEKVNKFSDSFMQELNTNIDKLASDDSAKGAVIYSTKPGIFIAGADIDSIAKLEGPDFDWGYNVLRTGQKIFQKINDLNKPVVTIIEGAAMGGGFEFALACHARIMVDDNGKTRAGLPENQLGIIPAWGGTQRLPRLIGVYNTVDFICTPFKTWKAKDAFNVGAVDFYCPSDMAQSEAKRMIADMLENEWWKIRRDELKKPLILPPDEKVFTFGTMRPFILAQTKGQYPAQIKTIDSIEKGIEKEDLDEAFDIEATICAKLMGTPVSRSLINVFYLDQMAKSDKGVDSGAKPKELKTASTLGAGIMGGGIATAFANVDIPVIMKDVQEKFLKIGYDQAYRVFGKRVKKKKMEEKVMVDKITMIKGTLINEELRDVDVLVEAVPENMDLKKKVFADLGNYLKDDCIVTSNTSSLSITEMASAYKKPENFVGMHFFNPVDRMPLVEVIRGEKSSDEAVATVVALVKKLKKTPIVVKDGPGFLVNRLLMPYMGESLQLLCEGYSIDDIDKISVGFGMPMGPIMLSDMVGNDTGMHAGAIMATAFPDRVAVNNILPLMNEAKRLGTKNLSGFYLYKKGRATKPDPTVYDVIKSAFKAEPCSMKADKNEMTQRLFYPMLNEATRILEEGMVRDVKTIDTGMIFGTGFPPFRGGLLFWADTEGVANIVENMKKYEALGKRYQPTEMLKKMAANNEIFYK